MKDDRRSTDHFVRTLLAVIFLRDGKVVSFAASTISNSSWYTFEEIIQNSTLTTISLLYIYYLVDNFTFTKLR